jgi:hypothetical protein
VEQVPTLLVENEKLKDPIDVAIYMLYTSIFPDHLKIAVVKPLYKIGDKN